MGYYIPTLDDFPANKANCATCTQRRTLFCEREKRKTHKGYIKGHYGEISGVVYCCVHYEGKYQV